LRLPLYVAALTAAFHLFVVFFEEPLLRRKFGASYEEYCRRVPRWVPRVRPL
jgi:protein-S-isoprenylcysteine O-methyltransferase Ste14